MRIFRSSKLSGLVESLSDDTYKQLKLWATGFPGIRKSSKATAAPNRELATQYVSVSSKGVITFVTSSGTSASKSWTQRVQMLDLDKLLAKHKDKKKPMEIVRLALKGNIKLNCNDPSWLYWGFKYKAYVRGYGMNRETRFPKIRNPQLRGTVCKHLDNNLSKSNICTL